MSISVNEVELLILENALDSANEHVARCERRVTAAKVDLDSARAAVSSLAHSIKNKRDEWLLRSVV